MRGTRKLMKITCAADLAQLPFPFELPNADLSGAVLRNFNFLRANLRNADFRNANLEYANFEGADLTGADLTDANFQGADLAGADLTGAKLPEFLVKLPPLGGSFIAWKKVWGGFILKLEIPADSPRVSTFIGRKCRAKTAKVLEAFAASGESTEKTEFRSLYNQWFIYRVGETVEVLFFDNDIRVECTDGIHFFETREEAVEYDW